MQLGAGRLQVDRVGQRIAWYRSSVAFGPLYYSDFPDQGDQLTGSDLANACMLGATQGARKRAEVFRELRQASDLGIEDLPDVPLAKCNDDELIAIATGLARRGTDWPGFGISMVSKTVHRRRRVTIPILDRRALSGAYVEANWQPGATANGSDPSESKVLQLLQGIRGDLSVATNSDGWAEARSAWPELTDVELFDVLWWSLWWNDDFRNSCQ